MQIKKTPREDYPGVPRFESAGYETPASSLDDSPPTAFAPRQPRSANLAASAPESDDRTAVQATRSTSVIDRHSSFDGQFETEHDLRVEGSISGVVVCRGLFSVEREATARATIQAHDAHVQGRLEGDITCSGKLLLAATAHVTGTLKAGVLVVEEGATVSGTVDTTQSGVAPVRKVSEPAENGATRDASIVARQPRRDLPSFAIVASDERATADRN